MQNSLGLFLLLTEGKGKTQKLNVLDKATVSLLQTEDDAIIHLLDAWHPFLPPYLGTHGIHVLLTQQPLNPSPLWSLLCQSP